MNKRKRRKLGGDLLFALVLWLAAGAITMFIISYFTGGG